MNRLTLNRSNNKKGDDVTTSTTTSIPPVSKNKTRLSWLTSSDGISFGLFIFLTPLIIVIFLPLLIVKCLRDGYLRRSYPKGSNVSPLTPHDSIFAVDKCYAGEDAIKNASFASNVTMIFVDGDVDLEELRSRFQSLAQEHFRLRSVLEKRLGGFYFRSGTMDIASHVRKVRDFDIGQEDKSHERELEEYIGALMTRVFPKDRPLWEVEVFGRFKNHQSVVVIRIHHTVCDGYSFNNIVDTLIGETSTYRVKNSCGADVSEGIFPWKRWARNAMQAYSAPRLLFRLYEESVLSPLRSVFTRRKSGRRGYFSMTKFDLDKYKLIRRRTRSHFASVGMTLMTGALRRFLLEQDSGDQIPSQVSIMHSLPKSGHPLTRLVNHWNVGLFKNAISIASPIARLDSAERDFHRYTEEEGVQQVLDFHMPLLGLLPAKLIELLFSLNFGTGMGFTSVPAFENEATFLKKHRVIHMCKVFGLQWQQTAAAVAVYTHNGEVGFTMFGHEDIVGSQDNIERIVKVHLRDEFELLLKESEERANMGGRFFA